MSQARALQYNELPQGASGAPVAAYAAAPSGVGMGYHGMPMGAAPVLAANEMVFDGVVNTASLPPLELQQMWAKPQEGPVGGQLATTGIRAAGGLSGLAQGTATAAKILGKNTVPGFAAITAGFDAWGGARDRKEGMAQMTQMYAPVIAEAMEKKLGRKVLSEEIDEKALREVAKDNKVLEQAVSAYDDGVWLKAGTGAASGMVGGGAFAAATAVAVPVLGFAAPVAGMAAAWVAGSLATKVFDTVTNTKDISETIHAKVVEVEQKQQSGQMLSAKDVFGLHAKMNGGIQKRMEDRFGTRDFDALKGEQQATLMGEYQKELPLMQQEAFLVNAGYMRASMVPFVSLNNISATMTTPNMQAGIPDTAPVMQVQTSGAQVEYMQPRAQAQGVAGGGGGYAANIVAQRAAANDAAFTLSQRG
jgi:hypothetical protein